MTVLAGRRSARTQVRRCATASHAENIECGAMLKRLHEWSSKKEPGSLSRCRALDLDGSLGSLLFFRQAVFRLLGKHRKCRRVMHRDVREHLAIDRETGNSQPRD